MNEKPRTNGYGDLRRRFAGLRLTAEERKAIVEWLDHYEARMARSAKNVERIDRLERTIIWLAVGLAVPILVLGLVVGLTIF